MRKLIYFAKRILQKNHRVYFFLYEILTLNGAKLEQLWNRQKYWSRFGGMWTDRKDFPKLFDRIAGQLLQQERGLIEKWRDDGYVVLKGAVPAADIDNYLSALEQLKTSNNTPLLATGCNFKGEKLLKDVSIAPEESIRIVDDYMFLPSARKILFNERVVDFLKLVFQSDPVLTQTLQFTYGSTQGVHQDTAFVRMTSPFKLAAIWVALEDVKAGAGELVYYPGSHRWNEFLFSGLYTHYDEERDGVEELERWNRWLQSKMADSEKPPERFLAKKGDMLIWHAGLAHGGMPIIDNTRTRLSLVGHYCPSNARPLYHFYKPQSRKIYRDKDHFYTSSYY